MFCLVPNAGRPNLCVEYHAAHGTTCGSGQVSASFTPSLASVAVCVFVGCLTSQQQACVSQGRICSDNLTCSHAEIEVADPTFYLTQSQCTDTGPTSPSADPVAPGAWQDSHWSVNVLVTGMTRPRKKIPAQAGFEPGTFRSRGGRLTTRPTRRSQWQRRPPRERRTWVRLPLTPWSFSRVESYQ